MPRRDGTGIELLADPTRRRIIAMIAVRPRRPSGIARELGVHRSTATHQLRQLEEAGLIMSRRTRHDGRGVLYLLDPRRVGHVIAWLAGTEVGGPFEARPEDRPARPILDSWTQPQQPGDGGGGLGAGGGRATPQRGRF